MNKLAWYLVGIMAGTIIILSLILIYREPSTTIQPFNDKSFKDSINYLIKDNSKLHSYNDSIARAFDSVSILKQTVSIRYNDKIIFLDGASTDELDSYIRSNW
jgi:hypothetical protein